MPGLDKMREAQTTESQPAAEAEADGFATAADFKNRFRKSTYTLQDGLTIEYRALLPMDHQTFSGSAIRMRMTEAGLDYNDGDAREKYLDTLSVEASNEIVVEAAKQSIVQAALNPKFSALPASQCPPDKVSLDELSPSEIILFDTAIQKFSGVKQDEEMFREPSETDAEDTGESVAGSADEHADGGTDSEGVSSESV